jgi:hypothetical protein
MPRLPLALLIEMPKGEATPTKYWLTTEDPSATTEWAAMNGDRRIYSGPKANLIVLI